MTTPPFRTSPLALCLLATLVACGSPKPPTRPAPPARAPQTVQLPVPRPEVVQDAQPPLDLYSPEEALDDALTGEWEYLGTGRWPGISRARACVFLNARVFVVNVYCTITEQHAFRLDVYSPRRGHIRFYAEAEGPVSEHMRSEYFTFRVESAPPPSPDTGLPQVTLDMSFDELRAYDEARYEAFLPSCFGGEAMSRKQGGCLGALAPQADAWAERTQEFLEAASADWYWVIRQLRPLARRYGIEIDG